MKHQLANYVVLNKGMNSVFDIHFESCIVQHTEIVEKILVRDWELLSVESLKDTHFVFEKRKTLKTRLSVFKNFKRNCVEQSKFGLQPAPKQFS